VVVVCHSEDGAVQERPALQHSDSVGTVMTLPPSGKCFSAALSRGHNGSSGIFIDMEFSCVT
jgi:hypothetical protein